MPEQIAAPTVPPILAATITRARVLYPLWCANAVAVAALDDRARLPLGLEARTSAPNASPKGDAALGGMMDEFRRALSNEWTLTQATLDASRYGTVQQLDTAFRKLEAHRSARRELQNAIERRTDRTAQRHRTAFFVQLPETRFESAEFPGLVTGYAPRRLIIVDAADLNEYEQHLFTRWRQEGPAGAAYPIAKRHSRDGLEMVLRRRLERGVMDSLLRASVGDLAASLLPTAPEQRMVGVGE